MKFMIASLPDVIKRQECMGNFKVASQLIRSMLNESSLSNILRARLKYELERIERLKKDFNLSRQQAFVILKKEMPGITEDEFERWIDGGVVDWLLINSTKRFYHRFMANLFRTHKEAEEMRPPKVDTKSERARTVLHEHIDKILSTKVPESAIYKVEMTLNCKSHFVKEGEMIRCWLPFPRIGSQQTQAKLISTFPETCVLAPDDSPQRTVYLEQKAARGRDTIFKAQYEYTISDFYVEVDPAAVEEYKNIGTHEEYLAEELPHVAFTPYLRVLAKTIVGKEVNPYLKAWKIYDWITQNVNYTSAYEYSTYSENISEYTAINARGDCGQQAMLFITLCRISGIPARWQSGWYMNPIEQDNHDWAQFYVEPYGWLFADPSFGGARREEPKYRRFYFGNIDHFRLVFNSDISAEFTPPKKFIRSDPFDNQRGELEWEGGNIYYDDFDYGIEIVEYKGVM